MVPADRAAQAIVDDLAGWDLLSAQSLNDLWDNEFDEVWNDA